MPDILRPGDITPGWCSKCGHSTPHLWQPGTAHPLECLECKEQKAKEETK